MNDFLFQPDEDGVVSRIRPNHARRAVAYVALAALGTMFLLLAMAGGLPGIWILPMVIFGALTLYQAERLRRASSLTLILTMEEVRDSTGRVLTSLSNVDRVERGAFALKPSNGFSIILKEKAELGWAPGVWWRMGRRIGVGGVVSAGEAKAFAEALASKL